MSGAAGAPRARIVGTGLIGTSIALALRAAGWPVSLEDPSPTAAALARTWGRARSTSSRPTSSHPT